MIQRRGSVAATFHMFQHQIETHLEMFVNTNDISDALACSSLSGSGACCKELLTGQRIRLSHMFAERFLLKRSGQETF